MTAAPASCMAPGNYAGICAKPSVAVVETRAGWVDLCRFHALAALVERASWEPPTWPPADTTPNPHPFPHE